MFTPEEKQFYEDLEWMRRKVRAANCRKPQVIKELNERFYRMHRMFHEQRFNGSIPMD